MHFVDCFFFLFSAFFFLVGKTKHFAGLKTKLVVLQTFNCDENELQWNQFFFSVVVQFCVWKKKKMLYRQCVVILHPTVLKNWASYTRPHLPNKKVWDKTIALRWSIFRVKGETRLAALVRLLLRFAVVVGSGTPSSWNWQRITARSAAILSQHPKINSLVEGHGYF